jgi:hypothetical protein
MACSKRVTTPGWHPIILFSPSVYTDTSLAHQIMKMHPRNAGYKVENVLDSVLLEHWDGD